MLEQERAVAHSREIVISGAGSLAGRFTENYQELQWLDSFVLFKVGEIGMTLDLFALNLKLSK